MTRSRVFLFLSLLAGVSSAANLSLQELRSQLTSRNASWTAGETSVSRLSEQEKKNILNWKNNTGSTLSARLVKKKICNNQYAKNLLLIYLYQYHVNYNSVIHLPWYIQRSDTTTYNVVTRGGPFFSLSSKHVFRYNVEEKKIVYYFTTHYISPVSRKLYGEKEKQMMTRIGLQNTF
jgi:hypothetical protein